MKLYCLVTYNYCQWPTVTFAAAENKSQAENSPKNKLYLYDSVLHMLHQYFWNAPHEFGSLLSLWQQNNNKKMHLCVEKTVMQLLSYYMIHT